MQRLTIAFLIAACGKSGGDQKPAPAPAPVGSGSAATKPEPLAPPAKPQANDEGARALLAKGTACARSSQGDLPLDCAEYKAMGDYAFQHQDDKGVAETCAAFLADPDPKKRLLAATCLEHLNARTQTTVLGFAMDAIETEKDADVRKQIAWGIKSAEATTAKLDDRVILLVNKLAADPKGEEAAGDLFGTLFPQYLMGSGPKPPPKAQALALDAIKRDGTGMQRTVLNALALLDDKPATCAALDSMIDPAKKSWGEAASGLADLKDACAANLPHAIEIVRKQLATDARVDVLRKYDRVFELDAATRASIVKALRAAKPKAAEWKRKDFDEAIAAFSKPKEKKTK